MPTSSLNLPCQSSTEDYNCENCIVGWSEFKSYPGKIGSMCFWYLIVLFPWDFMALSCTMRTTVTTCFRSVTHLCATLPNPMDCNTPGLPVPPHLPTFAQVPVHWISNAIQPSHPLMPSSPSALNLFQHQRFFQWVGCPHQMTKILQLQQQYFKRVFRVYLL